jgi:hypothetical protein
MDCRWSRALPLLNPFGCGNLTAPLTIAAIMHRGSTSKLQTNVVTSGQRGPEKSICVALHVAMYLERSAKTALGFQ